MKRFVLAAATATLLSALPALAAETHYTIDAEHTYPSVEFPHMGISVFRGKFKKTSGTVTLDRTAKSGKVDITIDIASIDFGHAKVDQNAQEKDWLDVAEHPTATYKGSLKFSGDTPSGVDGELTLRGVTQPVALTIASFKCIQHPMRKKEVCGADAEGDFDRAAFGMTKMSDNGLGRIHLRIQVEAVRDD